MAARRLQCLLDGARGKCPRCGGNDLFLTRYRFRSHCPDCGLPIESEDGWSLGAIPLNYAITCMFWVLPVGVLLLLDVLNLRYALLLAGLGCLVLPVLLYRFSKCLWLGIYYAMLPSELDLGK